MSEPLKVLEQTIHGYDRGHQLLAASTELSTKDLDRISQLSDLSGLPIGSEIPDYLTCYPLPSGAFYALARTWLDLDAPRDGCVLTHTILVPTSMWSAGIPARKLLSLHQRPHRTSAARLKSLSLSGWASAKDLNEAASDEELFALADGLFGSGNLPLVWLSEPARVEGNVANLLDFLWPRARMNFSVCTYALQERQIEGKPFHLLIAPSAALARYSKVAREQLIGYGSVVRPKPNSARRQLAERAAQALREGGVSAWPNLDLVKDQLPKELVALQRVAILDDLTKRSKTSPVSSIALLDLYEQIAPGADNLLHEKSRALENAIVRVRSDTSDQRLELLAAIYQRCVRPAYKRYRYFKRDIGAEISTEVSRNPSGALTLLGKTNASNYGVLAAIARGLASLSGEQLAGLASFATQMPTRTRSVLRIQPRLAAQYLFGSQSSNVDELNSSATSVSSWLDLVRGRTRIAMSEELVKVPQTGRHPELLAKVLDSLSVENLPLVIEIQAPEANSQRSRREIDSFLRRYPDQALDYFLSKPRLSSRDVSLCAASMPLNLRSIGKLGAFEPSFTRRDDMVELLAELLIREDWPNEVGEAVDIYGGNWLAQFIRYEGESQRAVLQACRLLLSSISPQDVVVHLDPTDQVSVIWRSMTAELGATIFIGVSAGYLGLALEEPEFKKWLDTTTLKDWLHSGAPVAGEVSKNARCLENEEAVARLWQWVSEVAFRIPDWSGRAKVDIINEAFRHSNGLWSPGAAAGWRAILLRNRQLMGSQTNALDAQAVQLSLCSRNPHLSTILATSFPPVYEATVGEKSRSLLDVLFMFSDWDKGKDLRRKLVETYSDYGWPLDDFALIAYEAGILSKIVSRCLRSGRANLLQGAVAELSGNPDSQSFTVRHKLQALLEQGAKEEWD